MLMLMLKRVSGRNNQIHDSLVQTCIYCYIQPQGGRQDTHYDLVDVKEKEQAAGWIKSDNKVYLCDLITSNYCRR